MNKRMERARPVGPARTSLRAGVSAPEAFNQGEFNGMNRAPSERKKAASQPDPELLRDMYASMMQIRLFEEAIAESSTAKEFKGPTHLYIGQEAVAVGVCQALRKDDYVFGGHRSHGHYLAKGGDLRELAAEIFVRETGCSKGRGGSMHLTAPDVGLLGTSALVGGGMGPGVGTALASVLQGNDRVTAIFFGDGGIVIVFADGKAVFLLQDQVQKKRG